MSFALHGLSPDVFTPLFSLPDDHLLSRGIKRILVVEEAGFPCRVSLQVASVGEEVLRLSYVHQGAKSPFHASGPIYVRRDAHTKSILVDSIPLYLSTRLLSMRAYSPEHEIVDADVTPGIEARTLIERFLANSAVDYLHIHFARRGCFACLAARC